MTAPLRVVAALLVNGEGRLLAGKRPAHKRQGGLWELPGGKVDDGESDAEALARELSEELAIEVEVGGHVYTSTHAYEFGAIDLHAYLCHTNDAPTALEHEALRWLSRDALWSVAWAPADVEILRRWEAL